jgi:hypothetical protein
MAKAIASFTPQGKTIASYELKDPFGKNEIDRFRHSARPEGGKCRPPHALF